MADLGATALFYSARPSLTLDGLGDPSLDAGLLSVSVQENTQGLSCAEVVIGNWGAANGGVDYLYFDRQTFDFGRRLGIEMGADDTLAQVFDGRITALEGHYPQHRPPELLLLAEDRFQDLRMVRRTRTFEDLSDQDVFNRIASEHGLKSQIDVTGPSYRVLAQVNQSDLAFLRERARSIDAEVWVAGDTLHAQSRERRGQGAITLTYGKGLHEFAVTADLAHQRTSLTASGWDVASKQKIEEQATSSAIQSELNGDLGGSQILQSRFGERAERIVHTVPLSPQEAQSHAKAYYRAMARRFVCGQGVGEGDGRIRVGVKITLKQLGGLFDGEYYVSEVKHTFDAMQGYRTHFAVERAGLGRT